MKNRTKDQVVLGIVVIILVVTFGILLFFPEQKQAETEEIKIGALFPLTGGLSHHGETASRSSRIALDEINKKGINGKKLLLNFQDHQCNSKLALSIIEQLTSTKDIKIFTSLACSGTVLSVAPIMEKREALLLGTLVTNPGISGSSPYVFRNWASDDSEARLYAEEITKRNYKKIGIIYEETDYAKGLKLSLEKYLNNSNVEIVSESFAPDSSDMRAQLTKLKSEDLDMLLVSTQTITSSDKIFKQMSDLNFKPKQLFINDQITKSVPLLEDYSDLLEGAIGSDYIISTSEDFDEFLVKYKETYGTDCPQPPVCAAVYDAIKLLAKAIEEKGYDAKDVKSYLDEVEYQGITGIISFDENNDRANAEFSLFVIEESKAVEYENQN